MKGTISALLLGAIALSLPSSAGAQQKFEMKIGHFTPAPHPMSVWLQQWADKLEKDSGGRIAPKMFPGAQLADLRPHAALLVRRCAGASARARRRTGLPDRHGRAR